MKRKKIDTAENTATMPIRIRLNLKSFLTARAVPNARSTFRTTTRTRKSLEWQKRQKQPHWAFPGVGVFLPDFFGVVAPDFFGVWTALGLVDIEANGKRSTYGQKH